MVIGHMSLNVSLGAGGGKCKMVETFELTFF